MAAVGAAELLMCSPTSLEAAPWETKVEEGASFGQSLSPGRGHSGGKMVSVLALGAKRQNSHFVSH